MPSRDVGEEVDEVVGEDDVADVEGEEENQPMLVEFFGGSSGVVWFGGKKWVCMEVEVGGMCCIE